MPLQIIVQDADENSKDGENTSSRVIAVRNTAGFASVSNQDMNSSLGRDVLLNSCYVKPEKGSSDNSRVLPQ